MRLERRGRAWLLVGGPVPRGFAAITLGRLVSIRASAVGDDALVRHELVHVEQYRHLGVPRFLVRYVAAYLGGRLRGHGHLGAYRRIPLEVEAVWRSTTLDRSASPMRTSPAEEPPWTTPSERPTPPSSPIPSPPPPATTPSTNGFDPYRRGGSAST